MSNIGIVRKFISGWNGDNLQVLAAVLATAARYNGEPFGGRNPKDSFDERIRRFAGTGALSRWIVHEVVEAPSGKVFVERSDEICVGNFRVEIRAVAVFEVAGGTIVSWHDYQDFSTVEVPWVAGTTEVPNQPV